MSAEYELLISEAYPEAMFPSSQNVSTAQSYVQYGLASISPSQVSAPDLAFTYEMEQLQLLATTQEQQQMSSLSATASSHSQYAPQFHNPSYVHQPSNLRDVRKRSLPDEYSHYDYQGFVQLQQHSGSVGSQVPADLRSLSPHEQIQANDHTSPYPSLQPSPQHSLSSQSIQSLSLPQHHHHHHRLPNQSTLRKRRRTNSWDAMSPTEDDHSAPSVVGQPGMPAPAPRPKGPKLKFTPEDDMLLVELKETKHLTWKQIADFFPGRTSGTLQVRYCTKLKAKTTGWTEEITQRLRTALQEYEADRWRIVAGKVGNGFSATACRAKALELEREEEESHTEVCEEDGEEDEGEDEGDDEKSESTEEEEDNGPLPVAGKARMLVHDDMTTGATETHDANA